MLTTTSAKTLPPLEGTVSLEEADEEGEELVPLVIYQRGRPFFARQATSVQLTISQGSHRPFVRIRIHWRFYHDYLHPLFEKVLRRPDAVLPAHSLLLACPTQQ